MNQHKTSFLNSSSVRALGEDGSSKKACVITHSNQSSLPPCCWIPPELTDNKLGSVWFNYYEIKNSRRLENASVH